MGLDVTKIFINKLLFVDLDGRNWREPMPHGFAISDEERKVQDLSNPTILSSLPNDPEHILVSSGDPYVGSDIYRVNVHRPFAEKVLKTQPNTFDYVPDRAGNILLRNRLDDDGAKGSYLAVEVRDAKGGWSELGRSYLRERNAFQIVGTTEDPNILIAATDKGGDKGGLYEYDLAARQLGEPIFKHTMFEAQSAVTFPYAGSKFAKQGEILGVTYEGPNGGDVVWTNPAFQQLDKLIRDTLDIHPTPMRMVDTATGKEATLPYDQGKFYRIISYSADLSKVVFVVQGYAVPPQYYLFAKGKFNLLGKAYPDIDPASLGTTSFVYYKARDGLTIPAMLTKPNEALCGAGPWAAVMHPHGGPWGRDNMGWDGSAWVSLMASRCYAVLRPQYRGSFGWGNALWKAGDAEWGQKMQDDKDDGAKWMIEQKIAKPDHIAIFGFSYGGYAAMAGAIRPNGIYKCAIAGAGVSNIKAIWRAFFDNPVFRDRQKKTVAGLNPVDFADKIKIPVMIYQGERDTTVPPIQSQWYVDRAKLSGQPVEYHVLADYAHGPAWTRAIFGQQLSYVETYLKQGCAGGL